MPLDVFTQSNFVADFIRLNWKMAEVRAICKQKGNKTDPNNYRPISVLPILGRTLEKLIATHSGGARPGRARSNDLADRLPPGCRPGFRPGCLLQRGRIACNAERCNTYSNSVCPSVCLSVCPSARHTPVPYTD